MLSCCSIVLDAGNKPKAFDHSSTEKSDSKLPQHSRTTFWKEQSIFVVCLFSVKLEGKPTQVLIPDHESII